MSKSKSSPSKKAVKKGAAKTAATKGGGKTSASAKSKSKSKSVPSKKPAAKALTKKGSKSPPGKSIAKPGTKAVASAKKTKVAAPAPVKKSQGKAAATTKNKPAVKAVAVKSKAKAAPVSKKVAKNAPVAASSAKAKVSKPPTPLPTSKAKEVESKPKVAVTKPAPTAVAPAKSAPAKKVTIPTEKAKAPAKTSEPIVAAANETAIKAEALASKSPGKKAAAIKVTEEPAAEPAAKPKGPTLSSIIPTPNATGALFYDSHMHTPLCKHAWGEPEEYAAQGLKAGLKGIIFTCHCPMPDAFWPTVRMADSEFDTYVEIVQRAVDAYRGKLEVCLGLESEYFPGYEKWIEKLHQRADFHYILGGVHWQSKEYLGKFETGTIEGFRRIYFEHLAQAAETGLYDCLAHPDLVKNYHPDSWCFAIVKNTTCAALDRIAKTGVAMELNTSGLNKSYAEMNPGNEMLRMMAERQIPVVIGSDAHRAQRVGEHFVTALNNLVEAGFEKVSYFQKRERIDLNISDVLASIKRAADANA